MAKTESKAEYFDINPANYGEEFMLLSMENRELYTRMKKIAAEMAAIVHSQTNPADLPTGYAVTGIAYTRWGQMQAIATPPKAESVAKPRKSLQTWRADQEANGDRA